MSAMSIIPRTSIIQAWLKHRPGARQRIGLSAQRSRRQCDYGADLQRMIAPSYWIDPNTGNNYMVTVQYFNRPDSNMNLDDLGRYRWAAPES